jgi:phosphoribosylformylglycinamidine cyclo-ligase
LTKRSPHSKGSAESSEYAALGASSSKQGVHAAVGYKTGKNFFAEVLPDLSGNPDYYSLLHADGAGTKSIVAYLAYRESGDPSWFRSLAQDSLVMNLDDVACVGAFENLTLSNTIGRNRFLVGDDCVRAIVEGYKETVEALAAAEISVTLAGGETADVGDLVRTVIVDSTLFARVRRARAVSFEHARPGDVIVAISGTGTASYERESNSGIGSNGLTLARHALISRNYAQRYPEIVDPNIESSKAYRGVAELFDSPAPLDTSIAKALLSPTRSYAPILKKILEKSHSGIHGIVHCSGGGQTKVLHFGKGLRLIKDNLFPVPPVFELIQATAQIPWREMYSVFNMGHRVELLCDEQAAATVIEASEAFDLEAKIIGRVEASGTSSNELRIEGPFGAFAYA